MLSLHRLVCAAALAGMVAALASCATGAPSSAPVTADTGEIGKLLRHWESDGTAAGNEGDWYDNRDRGHSMLDVKPYPQLQVVSYSDEEKKQRLDWALQGQVQRRVVFGNSSTSASGTGAGSNGRTGYCERRWMEALARQYRANNLYFYPEHQDHDPETGPDTGYGDLFPANTPYLVLSQGSSGSDQPFLKAVAFTLAAFRPEVKARLTEKGLLMPTVQMILRATSKALTKPGDYLTGKAHPSVFDGNNLDPLRMVKLAHDITPANLPPLAQVRLISADSARQARDYFDDMPSESLAETEGAIARVFRAATGTRRLVVSAEDSFDANSRPLAFHWVVLRGNPAKVRITPLNDAQSRAEILITYPERAPVSPGSALLSSRVDIGVFVHNGTHYSAPAFVTCYAIPSEARTFDAAGRLLEIGYGHGNTYLNVNRWPAFLDALCADPPSPAVQLLLDALAPVPMPALRQFHEDFQQATQRVEQAEQVRKDAETALKEATPDTKAALEAAAKAAREKAAAAVKERDEFPARKLPGLTEPWKDRVARGLRHLSRDLELVATHETAFSNLPPAAVTQRKRLVALGIIADKPAPAFELLPLHPGPQPAAQRLSDYQRGQLIRFQAELLAAVVPGLACQFRPFVCDFRVTQAKDWRDVYAYTPDGRLTGWTRYGESRRDDFTADGLLVVSRDVLGRCRIASPVLYQTTPADSKRPPWDWPSMRFAVQPKLIPYRYAGDSDRVGQPMTGGQ